MKAFVSALEKELAGRLRKIESSDLSILKKSLEASLVLGDAFCRLLILNIFSMKTTLFDSRFIRVAINGLPVEMSQAELDTEFENFQDAMRKLLFSDEGYIAIDFTLNDLLAMLCEVRNCKKK